jgi:hypothetical protein
MQIEKIVSMIRKSDIGNVMYKVKPTNNFLGVYGLKTRPSDIQFLETGTVSDLDHGPTIKKSQSLFRTFVPKDFAVLTSPKFWVRSQDNKFYPVNEYHLIDIDLYAYLALAESVRLGQILVGSTAYTNLFLVDGRPIDYTRIILENINQYSLILSDESKLIPYIYKKNNQSFFGETYAEDFLIGSFGLDDIQLQVAFEELNIFFDIKNAI